MRPTPAIAALLFGFSTVAACGASNTPDAATPASASTGPCSPAECGPEPPIAPSACPADKEVSSVCERGADGKCGRHVQCSDKH